MSHDSGDMLLLHFNLVQSHIGSPHSFELESGIAPLVPRGFDPACWGLYQPSPSRIDWDSSKVNTVYNRVFTTIQMHSIYVLLKCPREFPRQDLLRGWATRSDAAVTMIHAKNLISAVSR